MGNLLRKGGGGGGLLSGVSNINYGRHDDDDGGGDWDERNHGASERELGFTGQLPGELPGDGVRLPEAGETQGQAGVAGVAAASFSVGGVDPGVFFAKGRDYEPVNVNHR